MTIRNIFIDFGGVIQRTEDKQPRASQAKRLGMTSRDLEKIIFESDSSQQASIGAITEAAHWQAVANALGLGTAQTEKIVEQFFSGDRSDQILLDYLRSLRPEHKVCLISNAWSGLRSFITRQKFEDVFDDMIISAEVKLVKPDPRIYLLALQRLNAIPGESVFLDDVLVNVQAARSVGMKAIHFTQPDHALEELMSLVRDHR